MNIQKINLSTLIGVKNLELLIQNPLNTHVVVNTGDITGYEIKDNDFTKVDYSKVIGFGSKHKCIGLVNYLRFK